MAWIERLSPEFSDVIRDGYDSFQFNQPFESALEIVQDEFPQTNQLQLEIKNLKLLVEYLVEFKDIGIWSQHDFFKTNLKPLLDRFFPARTHNLTPQNTFIKDEFCIQNADQEKFWRIMDFHVRCVITNDDRLILPFLIASHLKAELRKWEEKIHIRLRAYQPIKVNPPSPIIPVQDLRSRPSTKALSNLFHSCNEEVVKSSENNSSYHSVEEEPAPAQNIEADHLPQEKKEEAKVENLEQSAPPPFDAENKIFFNPRSSVHQRYLAQIGALQTVLIKARNQNDGLEDRINYLLWARDHTIFESRGFGYSEAQKRIIAEIRRLRKQLIEKCNNELKNKPSIDSQLEYLQRIRRHPTVTKHANTKLWHFPFGRTRTATVLDQMIKRLRNR